MTTESRLYNCFTRNGGNAIPKHAGPEAKVNNPTTGLTGPVNHSEEILTTSKSDGKKHGFNEANCTKLVLNRQIFMKNSYIELCETQTENSHIELCETMNKNSYIKLCETPTKNSYIEPCETPTKNSYIELCENSD